MMRPGGDGFIHCLLIPRRGLLFSLAQWNRVRIEAVGSEINTWINGVHVPAWLMI